MQRAPIKAKPKLPAAKIQQRFISNGHRVIAPVKTVAPLPIIPYAQIKGKVRVTTSQQYNECFDKVKQMCETLEFDGYSDEILMIGYNVGETYASFKSRHPTDKIICYQLEQLENNPRWFNDHAIEWFKGCNEIWDYDLENITFLNKQGYNNVKFMPLRYYEGIKTIDHSHKDIDILFYGSLNAKRKKHLDRLSKHNIKILDHSKSVFGEELDRLISRSKIILNLHYYDSHLQEQVRLFPLVANDCCVLSEPSRYNYFGNLIQEFYGDVEAKIDFLLSNDNWRNLSIGIGEKFKNRKFKVGVAYNTFYGLEQIQASIDSIKPIVDYIVIVHQHRSFEGEPETAETQRIISELQKKYDVVFYDEPNDVHNGVIVKRNIGLDHCQRAGCDFMIPLDTDEEYDCSALMKDIYRMWDEHIETLYSPIQTYYYDRNHYFADNYYVPTVFRINGRRFGNTSPSVLCDPARIMPEGKYEISKNPMRHYSYMKETYDMKIKGHVMKGGFSERFKKAYEYMKNWKDGMPALAFTNSEGHIQLAEIALQRTS